MTRASLFLMVAIALLVPSCGGDEQEPAPKQGVAPKTERPKPGPPKTKAPEPKPEAIDATRWPRRVTLVDGTEVVIHPPQVDRWDDCVLLEARAALSVKPKDAPEPFLGAVRIQADTWAELKGRTVTLYRPRILAASFPTLPPAEAERLKKRLEAEVLPKHPLVASLDFVLANLEASREAAEAEEAGAEAGAEAEARAEAMAEAKAEPGPAPEPGREAGPGPGPGPVPARKVDVKYGLKLASRTAKDAV